MKVICVTIVVLTFIILVSKHETNLELTKQRNKFVLDSLKVVNKNQQ